MNKSPLYRACQLFAALFIVVAISGNATAAGYYAQAGKLYDASGQEIQIRGINHYGFNATILQPQFLWAMGWKEQIAQIKSLGFNAIRLPYSSQLFRVSNAMADSAMDTCSSVVDSAQRPWTCISISLFLSASLAAVSSFSASALMSDFSVL